MNCADFLPCKHELNARINETQDGLLSDLQDYAAEPLDFVNLHDPKCPYCGPSLMAKEDRVTVQGWMQSRPRSWVPPTP